VGAYRQFRRFPADGVRVVARVAPSPGQVVSADVEFVDAAGGLVARIDGFECVLDAALNAAFRATGWSRRGCELCTRFRRPASAASRRSEAADSLRSPAGETASDG